MGRYGSSILTIAGTLVGAYVGGLVGAPQFGAAIGASLGGLAGSLLFPTTLPTQNGPRLADISSTTSTVGAPIPRGWGTFPAVGNIIAQTDLREVIESSSVHTKGQSQTSTTPTYYQDFAIGLNGDNIYNGGRIAGVRTIWANGKPIYDRRPRREDEDDATFNARMAVSDATEQGFVLYLGTEDQLADPTLESFYGVGNISAFRGLAYIVFVNWQNKGEDGNRMPSQWQFEVYTEGDRAPGVPEYANEVIQPWGSFDIVDPRNLCNLHEYNRAGTGYTTDLDAALASGAHSLLNVVMCWSNTENTSGAAFPFDPPQPGSPRLEDPGVIYLAFNWKPFPAGPLTGTYHGSLGYFGLLNMLEANPSPIWWDGQDLDNPSIGHGHGVWHHGPTGTQDPEADAAFSGGGSTVWAFYDTGIKVRRIPTAPKSPCDVCGSLVAPPPSSIPGYCIDEDGNLVSSLEWTKDTTQNYHVLQSWAHNDTEIKYPLDPALPVGHADDNETFWTAAYNSAVDAGLIADGLIYGTDYPDLQAYGYTRTVDKTTIDVGDGVAVGDIIRDLCLSSGLQASDFDVTGLVDSKVTGFVRTSVMAARAAIDPLRQACFFDGFESDGKLKFRKRGSGIVLTLDDSDLGWADVNSDMPSKITTTKADDVDLPRQVFLQYISPSRDYGTGQQLSPIRIGTNAVNDSNIQLTLCLKDDQAAQIASILWADAWAGRWSHEIVLDQEKSDLEPSDPLAVPVDGETIRMRITGFTDTFPNNRKLELQRDDDGSYVSTAVATGVPIIPAPFVIAGPVEMIILDLPLLVESDNDAGFYAAMRPYLAGPFRGAAVFRSMDSGSSYAKVADVSAGATIGTLLEDVATGPSTIWDEGNTITLKLNSGTLENHTEEAVMEGANVAAIGADGRWEVIQFTTATNVSDKTWELSGLLRGRRGTEFAIGTSVTGDRFVLLSDAAVVRIDLATASVGRTYLYKAVGSGTSLDTTASQEFTGNGVALKPFSPVDVTGTFDNVTQAWTVTWIRRGRIGGTMMSGTDIPLSEQVEDYEVQILSADGTEVVRTVSVSQPSFAYTEDEQVADLDSVQPHITIVVYQISASVGRGYGTTVTLFANGSNDPSLFPFVADTDDNPLTILYAEGAARFLIGRTGTRSSTECLGIYSWDGSTTPEHIADTYDGRTGPISSYIPKLYFSSLSRNLQDFYPTTATSASDSHWSMFWGNQLIGDDSGSLGRWLMTDDGTDASLVSHDATPLNENAFIAMVRGATTTRAIVSGTPATVYTSANGRAWTFASNLTGDLAATVNDSPAKIASFGGATYLLSTVGLYANSANDLIDWSAVTLPMSGYSSYGFLDIGADATAIMIHLTAVKTSDSLTYNVILHSTDGTTWTAVREVEQSVDNPGSGPTGATLVWKVLVKFSTGFILYGKDSFSGSFPYALISTDHGATWTAPTVVDVGDVTNNATITNAISSGSIIVASDTNKIVDTVRKQRISSSTDGVTFTPITF